MEFRARGNIWTQLILNNLRTTQQGPSHPLAHPNHHRLRPLDHHIPGDRPDAAAIVPALFQVLANQPGPRQCLSTDQVESLHLYLLDSQRRHGYLLVDHPAAGKSWKNYNPQEDQRRSESVWSDKLVLGAACLGRQHWFQEEDVVDPTLWRCHLHHHGLHHPSRDYSHGKSGTIPGLVAQYSHILLGRSRRRSHREPVGVSRDLCRHHRHEPPHHLPAYPAGRQKDRPERPLQHGAQHDTVRRPGLPAGQQRRAKKRREPRARGRR